MIKGEIQYMADTLLLEKLATIEFGLTKNAGLIDMFSSLFGSIKDEVAAKVKEKGVLTVLGEYLTEGAIISLLGPWGIPIEAAASYFGFDIGAFAMSIFSSIKDQITNGQSINLNDVNQRGKELGNVMASDMFLSLRKSEFNGTIVKNGGMLSGLLKGKSGKQILIGIITWVIKSILIGAGVNEGAKAVKKVINPNDEEVSNNEQASNSEESVNSIKINIPPPIQNSFTASGDGNQYHINDGSTVWIVPLINKSIEKTLIWWATTIYPELKGHENELAQLGSFNNMASVLKAGIEPSHPDYLTIPQGLHSRKEVVDRFAGEIKLKDFK
jgi:hypothetical protein